MQPHVKAAFNVICREISLRGDARVEECTPDGQAEEAAFQQGLEDGYIISLSAIIEKALP